MPCRRYSAKCHGVGHPGGDLNSCAQVLEPILAAQSGWTRIQCLPDVPGPGGTRGAAESSRGGRGGLVLHACAVRCCRASYQNVSEHRDRHSAVYRYNDYASTHYTTRLAVGIGLGLGLGSHGEPQWPSRVDVTARLVVPRDGTIALARGRAPTVGRVSLVQAEVAGCRARL